MLILGRLIVAVIIIVGSYMAITISMRMSPLVSIPTILIVEILLTQFFYVEVPLEV